MVVVDPKVEKIYSKLHDWTNGKKPLTKGSMIILITQVIRYVQEEIPLQNRGDYKKKVAMDVLRLIVRDIEVPEEEKLALRELVELTAPTTIDTLIEVSKHTIELGKRITQKAKGCLGCI